MHRIRSIRFRLYPNAKQQALLVGWLDLHRELYNAALQQRLYAWQRSRSQIGYKEQVRALPKLKTYYPEYLNCGDHALCATLRRVDAVCNRFYTKRYVGVDIGFPRFKSASRFNSIVYAHPKFYTWKIRKRLWKIDIPNIGSLRARGSPRINITKGKIQQINLRLKNGQWELLLTLAYDLAVLTRQHADGDTTLGLSIGSTDDLLATSDGYIVKFPPDMLKLHKKAVALSNQITHEQPVIRKEKEALRKFLTVHKSLLQKRRDFLQQVTTVLVARYKHITIARSRFFHTDKKYHDFINGSIGLLCFILIYKAEEAGGRAEIISAFPYKGTAVSIAKQALVELEKAGQELAKMPEKEASLSGPV